MGCFSVVASVPKVLATSVAVVSTTLIRAQEIPRWTHSVLAGARREVSITQLLTKTHRRGYIAAVGWIIKRMVGALVSVKGWQLTE